MTRLNSIPTTRATMLDPNGCLAGGPHAALVLVHGAPEADVATLRQLRSTLPVVATPQGASLTWSQAGRIAAVMEGAPRQGGGTVYLWPSAHGAGAADSSARMLLRAGVVDVLLVGERGGPSNILRPLGLGKAQRRLSGILDAAEMAGPFDPDNPYETRRGSAAAGRSILDSGIAA